MKTLHLISRKEFEVAVNSINYSIPEDWKFTDKVKVMNWILHQWLQNLEKNMPREYVDVEPGNIVTWMKGQGWSIGKVIQCVEVLDKKFVRVDSMSLSSINAFALVELASSNSQMYCSSCRTHLCFCTSR